MELVGSTCVFVCMSVDKFRIVLLETDQKILPIFCIKLEKAQLLKNNS